MAKPTITLRNTKAAALTYQELDDNFENLRDATLSLTADTGGTQVTADLNGTITLVAGDNVTITGDDTAKTITIASTGGGAGVNQGEATALAFYPSTGTTVDDTLLLYTVDGTAITVNAGASASSNLDILSASMNLGAQSGDMLISTLSGEIKLVAYSNDPITLQHSSSSAVIINNNNSNSASGLISTAVNAPLKLTTGGYAGLFTNGVITLSPGANGNITIAPDGTGLSKIRNLQYNEKVVDSGVQSGLYGINGSLGNVFYIELDGNIEINGFIAGTSEPGQSATIIIDGSAGTYTLTSSMLFAGGINTLTPGGIDILTVFTPDGVTYFASLAQDFQ
jgi:hypothetical protein